MGPRPVVLFWSICWALLTAASQGTAFFQPEAAATYSIHAGFSAPRDLRGRYSDDQLAILEKLNRADRDHLGRLRELVVPDRWFLDELAYSLMPPRYAASEGYPKVLVVHLPGQMFGAYEHGTLVRWGPVSSGRRVSPTRPGLLFLNWKSEGRTSTVNPDWFMPWYFNVESHVGLAFHAYSLPGRPASHGCIRLLQRDARWLFEWGDEWVLDATATHILTAGTPVLIVGAYDFASPPPWRSPEWLSGLVELPELPLKERGT